MLPFKNTFSQIKTWKRANKKGSKRPHIRRVIDTEAENIETVGDDLEAPTEPTEIKTQVFILYWCILTMFLYMFFYLLFSGLGDFYTILLRDAQYPKNALSDLLHFFTVHSYVIARAYRCPF